MNTTRPIGNLVDALGEKTADHATIPDLRQAQVTAVNSSTMTCTVQLSGDTVGISGVPVIQPHHFPAVNDWVWVLKTPGSLPVVIGEVDSTDVDSGVGWKTYTPTWTENTVNPVIGNGSITGRYYKIGRTVHYNIRIVGGTTTTWGSGSAAGVPGYRFGLPFTAVSGIDSINGNAVATKPGVAEYGGLPRVIGGTATVEVLYGSALFSTGVTSRWWYQGPATWASGCILAISGTYESST